jgi:hypothetical protein
MSNNINPFDYVKSINESKENLMVDDLTERSYNPYLVNRTLSYFIDTVFQSNEMNRLYHLGKKQQYSFLLNTIRKRKRWAGKWHKAPDVSQDVENLMTLYGYSQKRAEEVLPLLNEEQKESIRKSLDPGGVLTTKTSSNNKKKK